IMIRKSVLAAAGLGAVFCVATVAAPAAAGETPKRGGTLTYMIPADAPPSLDGHRETTFATVHAAAPFYSVLIRVNPDNPSSTTDFVCDLCTEMPKPTDDGKTYTFKIRQGVKFHDGSPLTAADVAASWQEIVRPRDGVTSARESYFVMVDKVEAPDATTVVFRLKFATNAFLPALADPYAWIYKKEILDKDPHWFEKNIMGSGPFKFAGYEIGQSIKGVRNPDYYHQGKPYLDGFIAIFAAKQAVRVDAIRADRAAMEFRGLPPSARDELVRELGDKVAFQISDWNCGNLITPNQKRKPFDDVRVRRALALAIDSWHGAPALAKIATVHTVGGIVFPGSPLAASKEELEKIAGFWPDIGKSRQEARRLLKEAGVEGLKFELTNRNVDQPYKYVGTWVIDEWSKIGLQVTQRVLPTGPFYDALRHGTFDVTVDFNCQGVVNPLLDIGKFLPHSVYAENYGGYDDQKEIELYQAILHETDAAKQRAMIREFEKYVLDTQAHMIMTPWWNRIIISRSYVKGWKISPSHYVNQDLANVWLDK
ncbi:MAG TPA: ABC transporter substrate-binding protein, partial [Vicinamibacterales bacterium]|nr:ABC transporter substrate-binding protein [Vicinamibacterales bacterium]